METVNGPYSKKRSEIEIQTETRTAVNFYNGAHIPSREGILPLFFFGFPQLTKLKPYITMSVSNNFKMFRYSLSKNSFPEN